MSQVEKRNCITSAAACKDLNFLVTLSARVHYINTIVVDSAFASYAGATSTISAETMRRPSRPLRMVRSSLVDHPPVSGVPVAGAKAGSIESIYVY